ncbi:hypothetical protein K439DRAFT_1637280, partial [Ramaria rubella]
VERAMEVTLVYTVAFVALDGAIGLSCCWSPIPRQPNLHQTCVTFCTIAMRNIDIHIAQHIAQHYLFYL